MLKQACNLSTQEKTGGSEAQDSPQLLIKLKANLGYMKLNRKKKRNYSKYFHSLQTGSSKPKSWTMYETKGLHAGIIYILPKVRDSDALKENMGATLTMRPWISVTRQAS